jgi:hypothetical protein
MAAVTLKKTDSFESILIEMVEMHRKKQADYETDPGARYGTNFDEVSREVPIPEYDAVMDAYTMCIRKAKRIGNLLQAGREAQNETIEDSMIDLAVYAVLLTELHRRPEDPREAVLKQLGL